MGYEPQTRWSVFKFAVRNSYREGLAVACIFAVAMIGRAVDAGKIDWGRLLLACAGIFLFAGLLRILQWYGQIWRTKRDAVRKGWPKL
jgi:hypothetical protein